MWIRSQDKIRLLNIDLFFIDGKEIKYYLPNTNTFYVIGKYKSQQRALEVLDEIQEHIIASKAFDFIRIDGNDTNVSDDMVAFMKSYVVYEMPKE